ncbi:alpha/beta hydrolase [Acidaminobacter sp. JC074]|uniref:alpha/beta hydrolase family protein n=1 Tax=Acidaminobacter sp. JC074 TaxID=2530199 RepID=UPI001F116E25|nr:lysophospholipase [Acidaminobacter sp. JC074]MCH4887663.1 alpha/beta hydrolase [Acidaminobacter sp. JC074]
MIRDMLMKRVVGMVCKANRSPVLRRPDEYGMDYEDVFFPALDGVNLEGWYIPSKTKSNKVVICNHFSPGNRYGYAGHIRPYRSAGGFEVNFLPKYKALHEAGYNILAYDLRNHGFSASAQNGGYNPGLFEYKDVIGSLNYIKSREDTKDMDIHLHSMCLGGNATLVAMRKFPDLFKDVKSMMLIQPISGQALVQTLSKTLRMGSKGPELFEKYYRELFGYRTEDSSPIKDAAFVNIPTFVTQVKEDSATLPGDIQAIYDAIPVSDKKLFWIEGTKQRFKGYTYYSEHTKPMIDWYNQFK